MRRYCPSACRPVALSLGVAAPATRPSVPLSCAALPLRLPLPLRLALPVPSPFALPLSHYRYRCRRCYRYTIDIHRYRYGCCCRYPRYHRCYLHQSRCHLSLLSPSPLTRDHHHLPLPFCVTVTVTATITVTVTAANRFQDRSVHFHRSAFFLRVIVFSMCRCRWPPLSLTAACPSRRRSCSAAVGAAAGDTVTRPGRR